MDLLPLYVTLKLAFTTTAVLMVLGAPLAYFLAFNRFKGKPFIESFLYLPTALPPTVIGFYLIMAMGPKGFIGRIWEKATGSTLLFTFIAITIATVIYSLPFAVQPMKAAFQKIDTRLIESAKVLGLSEPKVFFKVVLPNSISGIVAAAVLVFIHTMGAFGVIVMVGGSIRGVTKVASIAIYEAVEKMDYSTAGILSLSMIPISFVFLLVVNKLTEKRICH
ncbi:molybdate ABC transporter permease subunit [candidate division WOR-3 bacterium]|nr:molybdate ABC transporter permease subunit [candidate division WOR-3 bacterium]